MLVWDLKILANRATAIYNIIHNNCWTYLKNIYGTIMKQIIKQIMKKGVKKILDAVENALIKY